MNKEIYQSNMKEEVTVAIIGAGTAGLNALQILNQPSENSLTTFRTTAFEQSTRIGGTWCYTDCVGTDELGLPVHSSMYKNLRTNTPKECMAFPDYPFPSHLPSFVSHRDVLQYLEDYTTHFDLRKYIKFKTIVEHIKVVTDENRRFGVRWEVTTADVTNREDKKTEPFDAVLVCNGHNTKPLMPKIPGLDIFDGHVMHSHNYKEPQAYTSKRVLVLGAKLSGIDISSELSGVATKVYLSHNTPKFTTILPPNIEQVPGIKCCHKRAVELLDGSILEVDAIILCTGYMFDFHFFDDNIPIKVEDGRVTPLYKHFLSVDFPSLGILGIIKNVILPINHVQIQYFKSVLEGHGTLPSKKEMMMDEEEELNDLISQGYPPRYVHVLTDTQFDYMKGLADLGNFDYILPPVLEKIFYTYMEHRNADFTAFRSVNYVMSSDGTDFTIVDVKKNADKIL